MIRWALLIVGLASIAFGITGYLMHPPIAETASAADVDEALALLAEHDRVMVTLNGRLDLERRIYPSLSELPPYTLRDPAKSHSLPHYTEEERGAFESCLGVTVRYDAALEPIQVALRGVEKRTLEDDEITSERVLAPLTDTGRAVWALSPTFAGEAPGAEGWMRRESFQGVLTRLSDIRANTATWTLEFSYEELRDLLASEYQVELAGDELVLIEGLESDAGTLFLLPVVGSNGALVASPFHTDQPLPSWTQGESVRGVMWVWDVEGAERRDLERVLGGTLPARRGVIQHDESASELNAKTTLGLQLFTGLGGVLLVLSAVGFVWHRVRSKAT